MHDTVKGVCYGGKETTKTVFRCSGFKTSCIERQNKYLKSSHKLLQTQTNAFQSLSRDIKTTFSHSKLKDLPMLNFVHTLLRCSVEVHYNGSKCLIKTNWYTAHIFFKAIFCGFVRGLNCQLFSALLFFQRVFGTKMSFGLDSQRIAVLTKSFSIAFSTRLTLHFLFQFHRFEELACFVVLAHPQWNSTIFTARCPLWSGTFLRQSNPVARTTNGLLYYSWALLSPGAFQMSPTGWHSEP